MDHPEELGADVASRGVSPEESRPEDPDEDVPSYDLTGRGFPDADTARIGLDRNTAEGAQLHFLSRLDGSKPLHRLLAWAILLVMAVLLVTWFVHALSG